MDKLPQQVARSAPTRISLMVGLLLASSAQATLPGPVADALASAGIPEAAVSAWVAPADGGPARLSHGAQTPRQVASVMKLFTTGVALQKLGPAYTWRTEVTLDGALKPDGTLEGNLVMRGEGDPSLVTERVMLLMTRLRQAGLRRITGDWVLDRSAFQADTHDPAAFDGEPLKPHNAGPDALLISHGAVILRLRPDPAHPGKPMVSMEPALDGVTLTSSARIDARAPCGDWRNGMQLDVGPDPDGGAASHWHIRLSGSYPAACEDKEWPLLWPESAPNRHTERALLAAWQQAGGQLKGQMRNGTWPAGARPWLTWTSPSLFQAVQDINKFSNNVMAQQLFLTLGKTQTATLDTARQTVATWVDQATTNAGSDAHPCGPASLALDNGSGLSRTAFSTPMCVGRWLQSLWRSPVMPELLASLPITGVDGTARRFTETAGMAHIKTGSLDGVVALAGIIQTSSGRRDVFVATVNDSKADQARPALRALLKWAIDNP